MSNPSKADLETKELSDKLNILQDELLKQLDEQDQLRKELRQALQTQQSLREENELLRQVLTTRNPLRFAASRVIPGVSSGAENSGSTASQDLKKTVKKIGRKIPGSKVAYKKLRGR